MSLCMSPINDSFMSGSLDHSVRIWDLRVNACQVGTLTQLLEKQDLQKISSLTTKCVSNEIVRVMACNYVPVYVRIIAICSYSFTCQGILHLRGRPTVAYDQQGLVFAVAMEGGAIKLFDSRSYDKVLTYDY